MRAGWRDDVRPATVRQEWTRRTDAARRNRAARHRILLALAGALCLASSGVSAARKEAPPPKTNMPPLPPAQLDDSLLIGGEDVAARKVRSRMTAEVQVNGQGPYRFVVDSGADTSVIGQNLARTLRLPPGRPVTLHAMTESSVVERVLVDELGLGQSSVSDLELPVLRDQHLGAQGMIGIDALVKQRLMMDFEKRVIKIEDAERPPPRMEGEIIVTARLRRGQLILTEVTANRKKIDAVVDTGSEITIGNSTLRDQLIRRKATKLETVEVTGVTGTKVELQIGRVSEIRIGSIILRDVPVAFADVPPFAVFGLSKEPSLLLGTDLMENFRRISLDFRARKVRFQLRRCGSTGITINSSYVSRFITDQGGNESCRR